MTEPGRTLTPITRPDGREYRPTKVIAHPIGDYDESTVGCVVFGTHDIERAQPLADSSAAWWLDSGYCAAEPRLVWWRDGMENGNRTWITDEVRGRAGVAFTFVEKIAPASTPSDGPP